MGILGENTWAKLTLSLLLFALLLHLVSFSTPHWAKTNEHKTGKRSEHIGLWKYCTYPINGGERCDDFVNTITSDWMKASQAFMTLGMFVLIGAICVVAAYTFVPDMEGDSRMIIICLSVITVAAVFNTIGVSVFGARYQEYYQKKEEQWVDVGKLSWSFALGVTTCVGMFISAGLMFVEQMRYQDIK